jgi:hypothetical protein
MSTRTSNAPQAFAYSARHLIERMKQTIDGPIGHKRDSQRLGTAEPPFGNLCYRKDLDRFTLREQAKVEPNGSYTPWYTTSSGAP